MIMGTIGKGIRLKQPLTIPPGVHIEGQAQIIRLALQQDAVMNEDIDLAIEQARTTGSLHKQALEHLQALRQCMDQMTHPHPLLLPEDEKPISEMADQMLQQLSVLIRTHERYDADRRRERAYDANQEYIESKIKEITDDIPHPSSLKITGFS